MPRKTAPLPVQRPARPLSPQPVQQPAQQLRNELKQQELHYEQRFDTVVAQLQQARAVANELRVSLQAAHARKEALFAETKALYEQTVKECERLRGVLAVKQEVIELLLPFYPHAISPDLRQQIKLR